MSKLLYKLNSKPCKLIISYTICNNTKNDSRSVYFDRLTLAYKTIRSGCCLVGKIFQLNDEL